MRESEHCLFILLALCHWPSFKAFKTPKGGHLFLQTRCKDMRPFVCLHIRVQLKMALSTPGWAHWVVWGILSYVLLQCTKSWSHRPNAAEGLFHGGMARWACLLAHTELQMMNWQSQGLSAGAQPSLGLWECDFGIDSQLWSYWWSVDLISHLQAVVAEKSDMSWLLD